MMDGFDPLDSRSPTKIYGKYLRYQATAQIFRLLGNELRDGVSANNPGQTFDKFDIVVLNFPQYRRGGPSTVTYPCPVPTAYVPQPGQPTRDQICQQLGYPRTVTSGSPAQTVDGGADYMERNAMVLVELIQRTKGGLAF